jgi:hypothetical protein
MIANNHMQYQPLPQDERFVIVPSKPQYVNQMVDVMCATYNVSPLETYHPDQFRSQIRVFPEGQFVALDRETGRVVGLTVSMRVDYQPEQPLLESWIETTNYG